MDAEGASSQLSWELMTALCSLQGKGRGESEGPESRRRPSSRAADSAEKRMSFESVSSLPEVSSQQAGGGQCRGVWSPDLQVCGRGSQAWTLPLGLWEQDSISPSGSLSGLWAPGLVSRQPLSVNERKGPRPLGRCSPLLRGTVSRSDQVLDPSARPPCVGHKACVLRV